MGRLYEFGCEQCGYQAEVSGGEDAGWLVATRTMTCLDCKRVVDVVVGESNPGWAGNVTEFHRCPRCRSRQVVRWPKSRPCPRCGGAMKKLDTGRVCYWD